MPRYAFGITVRTRLYRLRKTQRQLAAALGYSPSYISMILSGSHPSPELRRLILQQLDQWEQTP